MTPNLPKEVMCNMNTAIIPRPPALPPGPLVAPFGSELKSPHKPPKIEEKHHGSVTSQNSDGFRLVDANCQNDETGSVYSIYKQKIDSMFESDSSSTKNSVQAKIERMFHEVAQDNGMCAEEIGSHTFSVDYLGSVSLIEKVTSLSGLQIPLRELYFAYKKIIKNKKDLTGRLEISSNGLKVQYQGEKGDLEQLNSFPTIAVWSAVKFVIHYDNSQPTYAFLPLITDPDNVDKRSLFRPLDNNERKFITTEAHSPLFAVVMRKIGVQKQLECHGFVCQTSEDAIVIAATLYKSLVAHMKAKEKRPRNRNGVTTCMSIASSLTKERPNNSLMPIRPPRKKRSTTSSIASENDLNSISDTKPLLNSHRMPKKSIKTRRAPKAPEPKNQNDDLDAILPYEEPIKNNQINSGVYSSNDEQIKPKTFTDKLDFYMTKEQKQLTAEIKQIMNDGGTKCLKKVVRKTEESPIRKADNSGDILTKVTIPRSGSFLNAGGLTRYKNKGSRNNDKGSGGSPLGFKEIFNELSLQEGLHSLDDILSVIIDPEGMSFNDLKPIYKEFLLKLSVTLTKDELYHKSKSIMRRQKKKLIKKAPRLKRRIKVGVKFKRLKHIFQKNVKSIKLGKKSRQSVQKESEESPVRIIDSKLPESTISSSSYDTRQFRPKNEKGYRKKSRRDRMSTSEESDFFSLKKTQGAKSQGFNFLHNQNRNSSSGYVSCSECSYDSDTCTCISADKCYCSLGQKNSSKKRCCNNESIIYCDCDTDSCAESNKCYCINGNYSYSIKSKLKEKSNEINHHRHNKVCKKKSNTKSTRSLEYILNPTEKYYEKLKNKKWGTRNSVPSGGFIGNDYEKFSLLKGNVQILNGKMLNENGMGHCKPLPVQSYGSSRSQRFGNHRTGPCNEAISVKKSAEIAALFSDIKLSQTTDIAHFNSNNYDIISSKNTYNNNYTKYTQLQNVLYSLKQPQLNNNVRNGINSIRSTKANLYSAKNGLYTIQSQSDESRRSSSCERMKINSRNCIDIKQEMERNKKNVSNNIENSLGYLP